MAELAGIETVMLLQSADLFAHCRAQEVLRIASIARERRLAPEERIYQRGGPADSLYCVVRGEVGISVLDRPPYTAGPLATFGVEEILSGRLRTGDAVARTEGLVLAIDAEDFFDLLARNIEIVKALFRHLLEDRTAPGTGAVPLP